MKGGTLWDFSTSILSKNSKKIEWGPFEEFFSRKNVSQTLLPPFFRLCETFFQIFLMSPKGPPVFFDNCNRMDNKKTQRVPAFNFFGTMRPFKFLNFHFFRKIFNAPTEWSFKKPKGFFYNFKNFALFEP